MTEISLSSFRETRHYLQDVAGEQENISRIPRALLRSLGQLPLTAVQQDRARAMIKSWVEYVNENGVTGEPFALRYHIPRFAEREFGGERRPETLLEIPLSSVRFEGQKFDDIIADKTSPDILADPDFAIVGGAARLALKIHAGVAIENELPINDIDAVIASSANDIAQKAEYYGVDLSGAKIIDGKIDEKLCELVANFDCTMNQVGVYDGKLWFTQTALDDIQEGNIRLIAKNDPLFGSEGIVMPDGNTYISRKGFYRGLGFLIRGKGENLIVSQENIDQEKDNIGRYWQVLLFVKLLPLKDDETRYRAIGNWHELAKRIGSTQSTNPKAFLEELMKDYPETSAGNRRVNYDTSAQARWIIGRLIGRGAEELYESGTMALPESYAPSSLSLAESFVDYDLNEFMDYIQALESKESQ